MSKQYAPRTHATRANYPNKQDGLGQLEVISSSHNCMIVAAENLNDFKWRIINTSFPCHNAWLFIPKPLLSFTFLWPKWSHIHFVIWCHGMSYESLSKGRDSCHFSVPSLLFQLHCRGGCFIHVYSDSKVSCMCSLSSKASASLSDNSPYKNLLLLWHRFDSFVES